MTIIPFEEQPPNDKRVTSYDERHFVTYLRLLDADAEGANWREVAMIVFGIDPDSEPDRAQNVHACHLARARWMTESGYRHLLEEKPK